MSKPTTIGTWLEWAKTHIAPDEAELIAVHNFAPDDADRSWLITHQDHPLPIDFDDPLNRANVMVEERAKGEPLAYLFGSQTFYGRDFSITRDTLIPRPESEAIIDLAKSLDLPAKPRILDVGTGCGCLAITLALEIPQSSVIGVDFSYDALFVAEHNNHWFESRVAFARSDLLSVVHPKEQGAFDLIVANLPYVNPLWDWLDLKALAHEPPLALYPERGSLENGLSAYQRLFAELMDYTQVAPVANLILEADPCQHEELIEFARTCNWEHHATNGYALAFKPVSSQA